MNRKWVVAAVAVSSLLAAVSAAAQETRRFQPIERAGGEALDLEPIERAECDASVRLIAAAYGGDQLAQWLADEFPNRFELLDALDRARLRASSIELEVESVERVQISPWTVAGDGVAQSICTADVRTRLLWDDLETGERTVREVGRAQWRIRYERALP